MKATEDFLELVVTAHVLTAAKLLQETLPNVQGCTDLAKMLVTRFTMMSVPDIPKILSELNSENPTQETEVNTGDCAQEESTPESNDSVYSYAVDILTMGLFWYGFRDAVREGRCQTNCVVLEVLDSYI